MVPSQVHARCRAVGTRGHAIVADCRVVRVGSARKGRRAGCPAAPAPRTATGPGPPDAAKPPRQLMRHVQVMKRTQHMRVGASGEQVSVRFPQSACSQAIQRLLSRNSRFTLPMHFMHSHTCACVMFVQYRQHDHSKVATRVFHAAPTRTSTCRGQPTFTRHHATSVLPGPQYACGGIRAQ